MAQDNPQPIKQEVPQSIKIYVSGVAFGEKSTPDYTWDGVFIENKKLETKYLPNDVMNQFKELSSTVSTVRSLADDASTMANKALSDASQAQITADKAQTTAQSALSMLPTVTSTDSGKFLRVSAEGKWVAEAIANAEGASF